MAGRVTEVHGERGSITIVGVGASIAILGLVLIIGLVGSVYVAQAELQQAADVAAQQLATPVGDAPQAHAISVAKANGATRVELRERADGRVVVEVRGPMPASAGAFTDGDLRATALVPLPAAGSSFGAGGAGAGMGTGGATPAGTASGGVGEYSGPLVRIDSAVICPRVGAEFVAMQRAAAVSGVRFTATSGFRTYAEQAALYATLGPSIAAPPGVSLHHQATELDIAVGPAGSPAHRWLTANGGRFHFIQRYSWEPWHWGNTHGCQE